MIKMLIGVSGFDSKGKEFNVLPNVNTDKFTKEEEGRYIEKGLAEAVTVKAKAKK